MNDPGHFLVEEIGARSPGWYRIFCDWCEWQTTGSEPVCEDAWYEHAAEIHPRRYARA